MDDSGWSIGRTSHGLYASTVTTRCAVKDTSTKRARDQLPLAAAPIVEESTAAKEDHKEHDDEERIGVHVSKLSASPALRCSMQHSGWSVLIRFLGCEKIKLRHYRVCKVNLT